MQEHSNLHLHRGGEDSNLHLNPNLHLDHNLHLDPGGADFGRLFTGEDSVNENAT